MLTDSTWCVAKLVRRQLYPAVVHTATANYVMVLCQAIDYCPGGNLMALMEAYECDEDTVALLIAQAALAIDAVHRNGFAHR